MSQFENLTIHCYPVILRKYRPQKNGVKKIGFNGVKRKTPYSRAWVCDQVKSRTNADFHSADRTCFS